MGKAKASKAKRIDPHRALHSRISYLYQAATYLATHQQPNSTPSSQSAETSHNASELQPAARHLVSDLRSVALKGQSRLSPSMKHTICKNCNSLLIDGSTCSNQVENKSKGGKKSWADVLLRTCYTCGMERRFPVAAKRQPWRPCREKKEETAAKTPAVEVPLSTRSRCLAQSRCNRG